LSNATLFKVLLARAPVPARLAEEKVVAG
jgi:hypothetical protein